MPTNEALVQILCGSGIQWLTKTIYRLPRTDGACWTTPVLFEDPRWFRCLVSREDTIPRPAG